jgi:hypothetical protein
VLYFDSFVSFFLSFFEPLSKDIVIVYHFNMHGSSISSITVTLFFLIAATTKASLLPNVKGLFSKHGPQVNASDVRFTQYQRPGPDDC